MRVAGPDAAFTIRLEPDADSPRRRPANPASAGAPAQALDAPTVRPARGKRSAGSSSNAEAPIDVSSADNPWNEPEPDLIVLKREFSTFDSNPQPNDLKLVVEIAGSALKFDLTVKAALYARAAIVEYWVLDVAGRRLIAHRSPVSGTYTPRWRR
jgi:hypothetical protein